MPDQKFSIQILGNIQTCRTEAEIYLQGSEDPWAVVYEDSAGWQLEVIGGESPAKSVADEAVAAARERLGHYPNRRGVNAPAGLSGPGLSLWLMARDDGTAMGRPFP